MTVEQLTRIVIVLVPLGTTVAAFIAAYASCTSARASRISARVAESQRELAERQYGLAERQYELQHRHQELEERRAKQELYERRLAVYQAVRILSDAFSVHKPPKNVATFDDQEVAAFVRDTAESDFLFGDEITNYLRGIAQKARRLASISKLLDPATVIIASASSPRFDIDSYAREQNALQLWFDEQFKIAKDKFKPYLNISAPIS